MTAKVSATKVCPGCSARYPPDALFCPNDGSPLTSKALVTENEEAPVSGGGGSGLGGDGHDSYLGREISGHIEIQNLAGVGAMGRVYRAFQKGIDRDVAVKVLHRELSANQQLVARFHREAKVASRLQHPNVVQVHLAGQLQDGAMYIVMEYLDGVSLQSALAASPTPFPLERALHIALQICDAVGEAHSQGVIHRDIKPENVMLVRRGDDSDFVKVLDFGIARLNWGEQSMATAAGLIFGTARYISPEGAQGEAVGPAGDVYATATLLYQMLAGRTPFEGEQAVALLVQQIHDAPPPLRSLPGTSHVPESIAAVIMQNLAKSPANRAPDGRTFGRALVEAAKTVGLAAEDLVPRSSLFVPHARLSEPGPPPTNVSPIAIVKVRAPEVEAPPAPVGISPKTQLWSPPAGTGPVAARPASTPPPAPAPVDRTLDESSGLHAALVAPTPSPAPSATPAPAAPTPAPADAPLGEPMRVKTEPSMLPPVGLNLAAPTPPPPPIVPPPPPPPQGQAIPAQHGTLPLAHRPPLPSPLQARVQGVMAPGRSATFDAAGPQPARDRARAIDGDRVPGRRLLAVVVLCLLVGMLGASVVLYQLGMLGGGVVPGSVDDVADRADDAFAHRRWDSPAGNSVRDLLSDGLTKWPRDRRLLDLRSRATDELVKQAVGKKLAGDPTEALHLAQVAKDIDPADATAQHLVDEYERGEKKADPSPSPTSTPGTSATTTPTRPGSSHAPPAGATTLKVSLDSSLPHPRVGQSITFTTKIAGPAATKTAEEPHYTIVGPGLAADTKLSALSGPGGSYVASFTAFEPGKYDITFDAKIDGAAAHAQKTLTIEGDAPAPPPSAPTLPTVPSAKWL